MHTKMYDDFCSCGGCWDIKIYRIWTGTGWSRPTTYRASHKCSEQSVIIYAHSAEEFIRRIENHGKL